MVDAPVPQIQGWIAEVTPQFSERILEQIVDIPARPITEKMPEVIQVVPQEQFEERTSKKICRADRGCARFADKRTDRVFPLERVSEQIVEQIVTMPVVGRHRLPAVPDAEKYRMTHDATQLQFIDKLVHIPVAAQEEMPTRTSRRRSRPRIV